MEDRFLKIEDEKQAKKATKEKNPTYFLYKKIEENGDLSLIGSFNTEIDLRLEYAKSLDKDIPEEQLVGFKGRFLEFSVKETKRRIVVK